MKKPKMIRGGRALAAALAGATLFKIEGDDAWIGCDSEAAVNKFLRLYKADPTSDAALAFGVRADEARKVLGRDRIGKTVD